MKKSRPTALALVLGFGLVAAPVLAENAGIQEESQQETESFGLQALKERFEAAAPAVGDLVPEMPVYTAQGEKVQFRDLVLGHYSVVVFGCLT
jgi:hypothetical protein